MKQVPMCDIYKTIVYSPQALKVYMELKRREAKDNFWSFCLYYDPMFFCQRMFLRKVAEAFMRVHISYSSGIIYRLAVSMPPRAGKSYISSLFIAWMLGKHPEHSVMRNCCSAQLYNKLSYDTRMILRSAKFQSVFDGIVLRMINRT